MEEDLDLKETRREMAADKRLLVETLLALGSHEKVELVPDEEPAELVRACLLHVSSSPPEACASALRIDYESYEDDTTGTPYAIRGMTLPATGITLRDLVEGLGSLEQLPEPLREAIPELTLEDYRAGLYAIRTLLYALERSDFDAKKPARYSQEEAERALRATLRSLESFRKTGEP